MRSFGYVNVNTNTEVHALMTVDPLFSYEFNGSIGIGLGRLFGRFDGPNDGMVTVAETRLAGAADHIVLPVAHTSLLWSREVARQAEHFIGTGRFART